MEKKQYLNFGCKERSKKAFIFTMDVAVALMIVSALLLTAHFFVVKKIQDPYPGLQISRVASDFIRMMDNQGYFNPPDEVAISNYLSIYLSPQYGMRIEGYVDPDCLDTIITATEDDTEDSFSYTGPIINPLNSVDEKWTTTAEVAVGEPAPYGELFINYTIPNNLDSALIEYYRTNRYCELLTELSCYNGNSYAYIDSWAREPATRKNSSIPSPCLTQNNGILQLRVIMQCGTEITNPTKFYEEKIWWYTEEEGSTCFFTVGETIPNDKPVTAGKEYFASEGKYYGMRYYIWLR